ncbi:MAG: hypothetical protein AB1Z98_07395 [Nannocystaceae bacterium]
MTNPRPLLSLTALLLAGSLAGCDAEAPGGAVDYRAIGHADLTSLTSAPWLASSLKDGNLAIAGDDLGDCADVLQAARTVTFGASDDAFEVYVEGTFDAAAANACSDYLDAKVATGKARGDGHPKPEAVLLAEGVFVVFGGDLTPSRDRLESLLSNDPSKGQPLWITANTRGKDPKATRPVERVVAWANPSKGLRAHAEVVFADEAKATELYGKATLGLVAMSMSDEVGELASAVDLDSSGKTITAEIALSSTQMKGLVTKAKARPPGHDGHEGHGLKVEVDTSR